MAFFGKSQLIPRFWSEPIPKMLQQRLVQVCMESPEKRTGFAGEKSPGAPQKPPGATGGSQLAIAFQRG
jgi:hypothetical protein